jgi:ubiquinone/menaquinone biosynthesis C-methylase UbiE
MSQPEHSDRQRLTNRLIGYLFPKIFHLLYNEFAWSYDLVADIVSLGRWKSWINCVLPYLDKPNILELGYGPGHLQSALREDTASTFGIDSSKYMARIAANRLRQDGFSPHLVLGISQNLPYPDNTFNYVVCTFPSDYINNQMTLQEIWRVLDKSGELIVLAFAWITGDRWLERFAAWLFRWTNQSPDIDISKLSDHYYPQLSEASSVGFQFSSDTLIQNSSRLLILRARKTLTTTH